MKIFYNWCIPLPEYIACMFFGQIWARWKYRKKGLSELIVRHETIHLAQVYDFKKPEEKTLFRAYLRFYWRYLRQVLKYGYNEAPLEKEAKRFAYWPEYLEGTNRPHSNWKQFITK